MHETTRKKNEGSQSEIETESRRNKEESRRFCKRINENEEDEKAWAWASMAEANWIVTNSSQGERE